MKKMLLVIAMVMPLTAVTCTSSTAMARPAARAKLFVPGQTPRRPMEILGEMVFELRGGLTQQAALLMLQQRARELGADAVVDVVVQRVSKELPAQEIAGLPMVALGALMSFVTLDVQPLVEAARGDGAMFKRQVIVVRGVAVKFFR